MNIKAILLKAFCIFAGLVVGTQSADADIDLTSVGVPVTEDFNTFLGTGFAPSPAAGQLDSDTYRAIGFSDGPGAFGGTYTTPSSDFARGTAAGAVMTGGAYAFDLGATSIGIGVQPTETDFTPGEFTIRARNLTGGAISGFQFSAQGFFFNDSDRATRWSFSVSTDDINYASLSFLDSDATAGIAPAWLPSAIPIGGNIPFLTPLANGDRFYLKITGDDLSGTGERDQFALDNLSITAITPIPEPSSMAMLVLLVCPLLRRSRA